MKSLLKLFFLFLILFSSTVQAQKTSFTASKLMEYEFNDVVMAGVQFYISSMISLKREFTKDDKEQANQRGKVVFESGKAFEYYELKDGSFCVFQSMTEDKSEMVMRFGQGPGEVLAFDLKAGTGVDGEKYYVLKVGDDKVMPYGGHDWELISWTEVRLMVKESRKGGKASVTKTKGMKIDGTEKKGIKLLKKKH